MLKNPLTDKDYQFLFTHPDIKDRIMFLVYWGSYAHGTFTEESDTDVRGVVQNKIERLLGCNELDSFDCYDDATTDTTIYSFKRYVELLLNPSPNAIELLGCKDSDYIILTDLGKKLIDNRKIFLSKEVAKAFGGYGFNQLRKMQNILAKDRCSPDEREQHILNLLKHSIEKFNAKYQDVDTLGIKLELKDIGNGLEEVVSSMTMRQYPVRQFRGIVSDLYSIVKEYNKLGGRNKKKDDIHINKHAMHLVRVILTGIDMLETHDIHTNREKDLDELLPIKQGKFMDANGKYQKAFFDYLDGLNTQLNDLLVTSTLRDTVDRQEVNKLVVSINRESLELQT